ncbi:MAG TPA: gliding motility-associated C-terminal domain-containing protein, partial [Chitinophagaceae bacterium]|nr:gliding motility-associated C-terminal domain-containing protein [Chitinophagaceae bacterium]
IVISDPSPVALGLQINNATCNGSCNGFAWANPSGGTPPYTFLWQNGSTLFTASGLCAGTYTVNIQDAAGCSTTQQFQIWQPAQPLVTSASSIPVTCFLSSDGSVQVTVSGGAPPYNYTWSPSMQTTSSVTGLTAGQYTVAVQDSAGCIVTDMVLIVSPQILAINPIPDTVFCEGDSIELFASATGGNPAYTFSWQPGNTTGNSIIVSPSTPTTYTVSVSDVNNCPSQPNSFTCTPVPVPQANFVSSVQSPIIHLNQEVCFSNNSLNYQSITTALTGFVNSGTNGLCFTALDTGTSCINFTLFNNIGCMDTSGFCYTTYGIYFPNVFTPNGDGVNDLLTFPQFGLSKMKCSFYDRWGNLVIIIEGRRMAWDGYSSSGLPFSDGVYYFIIEGRFEDNVEFKETGFVHLIRE